MKVAVIGYTGTGKSLLCNRILKYYGKEETFEYGCTFTEKYITKQIKEEKVGINGKYITLIDTPPLDTYLNYPEKLGSLDADLYIVCISRKQLNINQTLTKIQNLKPNNFIIMVTFSEDLGIPASERKGDIISDRKNWNDKFRREIIRNVGLYDLDIFYELPDGTIESNIIFTSPDETESIKKLMEIVDRNIPKEEDKSAWCSIQ